MAHDRPSNRPHQEPETRAHERAWVALCLALVAPLLLACAGQTGAAPTLAAVTTTTPGAPGTSAAPDAMAAPPASPLPTDRPIPTPGPTVPRVALLQPPAYSSRVVVPDLGIDLPVISGDLQPPPSYPFCDVAAYVTRFNQPYEPGVTYISAHAQRGMFLPLLQASERQDGRELLGMSIEVYTSDGRRFDYTVDRVVRHAVDYAILADIPLEEWHLILQTSEGTYGTVEKLQVVASLVGEATVDVESATPEARPRDCEPSEPIGSPTP